MWKVLDLTFVLGSCGADVRSVIVGQRDILRSLLEFASDKERSAAETALSQGIELVFDEDELIEGEDDDEGQYDDA
jgi:hypothetical protein